MPVLGKKKVTDGIKLNDSGSVFYDLYVQQKRAIIQEDEHVHTIKNHQLQLVVKIRKGK